MPSPLYHIALSFLLRTRLREALRLIEHYGSAEEAWRHLDEPGMAEALDHARRELEWINAHDIRVWTLADSDYPYRLRQCPDRPLLLYGKGNISPSDGHIVSIVGTRKPTEYGKELTSRLVRELHERLDSLTVVSGGAYGIDIAAHRAAISLGVPTVFIPAHGLDRIYPYVHRRDVVASLANGGLLTEFPSGTEPLAQNFLQRNRIIAGLADAVVVVESREHGGSLVTARMAVDYDRELFAFPGRPDDLSSQGCNGLIRDHKAQLVNTADDLVAAMNWTTRTTRPQPVQTQLIGLMDELTPRQQLLLQKLQEAEDGLHINLLVMETGLSYSDVSSDLVMLELQGLVRSLPGGIYRFVR
ncbi:MAG: DNA-processing protein DprA [Paludibacteraceae bacterium]|nr:DNA-processing protein DprA [Paludibacteraceae bacterium]